MANQIPFLTTQALAGGRTAYYWQPSPRLREAGWKLLTLGEDRRAAILAALERNDEVEAWDRARAEGSAIAPAALARRSLGAGRARWRDLVAAYKADRRYLALKPKSRAEYDSSIKTLTIWADDGNLILSDLDRQMVIDLRDTLVNHDNRPPRTASLLRVLSLLLQFAEDKGLIAGSPARKLKIPTPPKRTRRILRDQLAPLLTAAADLDFPHIALGCVLGFYSMQREGDLLSSTGFQIREVGDVSSDARRALAGPDGKVSGLWLQQEKTGEWVAVSLAPVARAAVIAQLAASRDRKAGCTHLILYRHEDRPCPEWRFQRDFRAVANKAALDAAARQDHALAKLLGGEEGKKNSAIQFRDLRRSGMCWLRELHVPVPLIASISGHSIEETQKILDTYMPRDTRAAAEGMAIAVTRQAERDAADAAEQEERG
jgi:hypothetical protein